MPKNFTDMDEDEDADLSRDDDAEDDDYTDGDDVGAWPRPETSSPPSTTTTSTTTTTTTTVHSAVSAIAYGTIENVDQNLGFERKTEPFRVRFNLKLARVLAAQ